METRTETHFWSHVMMHVGLFLLGIAAMVLVIWMVTAEQKTKLYEADNVVCASQPGALSCFERKAK